MMNGEQEKRLMGAIGEVKKSVAGLDGKVEGLRSEYHAFELKATEVITTLKTIEENCPIKEVVEDVQDLKTQTGEALKVSNEAMRYARRVSAGISSAIAAIGAAVGSLVGWKGGSG